MRLAGFRKDPDVPMRVRSCRIPGTRCEDLRSLLGIQRSLTPSHGTGREWQGQIRVDLEMGCIVLQAARSQHSTKPVANNLTQPHKASYWHRWSHLNVGLRTRCLVSPTGLALPARLALNGRTAFRAQYLPATRRARRRDSGLWWCVPKHGARCQLAIMRGALRQDNSSSRWPKDCARVLSLSWEAGKRSGFQSGVPEESTSIELTASAVVVAISAHSANERSSGVPLLQMAPLSAVLPRVHRVWSASQRCFF